MLFIILFLFPDVIMLHFLHCI